MNCSLGSALLSSIQCEYQWITRIRVCAASRRIPITSSLGTWGAKIVERSDLWKPNLRVKRVYIYQLHLETTYIWDIFYEEAVDQAYVEKKSIFWLAKYFSDIKTDVFNMWVLKMVFNLYCCILRFVIYIFQEINTKFCLHLWLLHSWKSQKNKNLL